MKILQRTLPALTLFEWGAILSYFWFSGRIASFLHPMFRPWVLVTGILLVITALCVWFFPEESCEHDHEHEHEHEHEHGKLTIGSFIAFFLLLIPLALAATISTDSYGADLIRQRGLVEDIRALPGIHSQAGKSSLPSATPPVSAAKSLAIAAQENGDEPALPTQNGVEEDAPPTPSPNDTAYRNEFLKPDESGNIKVQVTDLLYAAQEPSTRKDFEGKRVEIIGQYLTPKKSAAKQKLEPHSFMLLRLVMVCCAADMMPTAVKIEATERPAKLRDTSWLKVVGRVHYRPRPKGIADDGIDYGDYPEPVIVAEKISKAPTPAEKYIY